MTTATETQKPSAYEYELAAKAHGWTHSKAHDGWIHPEERRGPNEADYTVMGTAEEACWLHEIDPRGGTPFAYGNGAKKHFADRA